jgi:N-acetylglucosamine-6-phosphate deacetylase
LEGPFLSYAKRGAQNADYLRDPDADMLARLQEASGGCVKLITMAPELTGGIDFIKKATELGVTVSVGHTTADYDTAMEAFAAGATHATHLYNGMPAIHHRAPGVIGAAVDSEGVRAELICDGIHIHDAMVRFTFRLFGAERMVIISDSLRATGMPDGQYPFGGQEIEVHGNRATIVGHPETLAGSVTSLMGCLRQAVSMGIPTADAVRACTYNPACAIGIDDRAGTLDIGKEASIILLDRTDLSVRHIIFKGNLI